MKEFVRTIKDYPIPGIEFRDITTLLQNHKLFKQVIDKMTKQIIKYQNDIIKQNKKIEKLENYIKINI